MPIAGLEPACSDQLWAGPGFQITGWSHRRESNPLLRFTKPLHNHLCFDGWYIWQDSNLQSLGCEPNAFPLGHRCWCSKLGSNQRRRAFQTLALPLSYQSWYSEEGSNLLPPAYQTDVQTNYTFGAGSSGRTRTYGLALMRGLL